MNIALLQLPTLEIKDPKLENYIKKLKNKQISLIAMGEYVLNDFFKEDRFKNTKALQLKTMMANIGSQQLEYVQSLVKKYKINILAPLILSFDGKIYKVIAYVSPTSTQFYHQQKLIGYEHWNEKKFFNNKGGSIKSPLIFTLNGVKCATLFGFELHFDEFWLKIKKEKVEVVIMPTASCFDSDIRWKYICKTRAFLNSVCLIRINKIGDMLDEDGSTWKFYGDSFIIGADGDMQDSLDYKEGMMIAEINPKEILEIKKSWGF